MAIVCICRGTKSGGRAMAECLAARLGYPVLGREVVQEAALELGVSAEALEEKMGDRPTVWSRFSSMRRAYVVAVQAALAERAAGGNLVYHGLAGGLLLRGLPGLFCLRLIAPLERRIQAVTDEFGMGAVEAERYIRDLDESRARWVKVMYGEDILDPALYDLVINLESVGVDGACALTARAVEQPEFTLTDWVRDRLDDFALSCRVKLALAGDADLRSMELDADAHGSVVVVTGQAPLRKGGRTGNRIHELARKVPGVHEVRIKVEWFDPYP
jgi:cytidylate kinase